MREGDRRDKEKTVRKKGVNLVNAISIGSCTDMQSCTSSRKDLIWLYLSPLLKL